MGVSMLETRHFLRWCESPPSPPKVALVTTFPCTAEHGCQMGVQETWAGDSGGDSQAPKRASPGPAQREQRPLLNLCGRPLWALGARSGLGRGRPGHPRPPPHRC